MDDNEFEEAVEREKKAMAKSKALCARLGPGWEPGISVSSEKGVRWRAQFGLDGMVVTIVEGTLIHFDEEGEPGQIFWQAGVGYNRCDPHITANSVISPAFALGEVMEKAEKAEKMAKRAFQTAQDMYNRVYASFEDIEWDETKQQVLDLKEKK